jgi:lipoprotein-anchoring transpeptidase ErfK/SrfK
VHRIGFGRPLPIGFIAASSILAVVLATGCGSSDDDPPVPQDDVSPPPDSVVTPSIYWRDDVTLSPDEIERGRLDRAWREYAERDRAERDGQGAGATPSGSPSGDTTAGPGATGAPGESLDDLTPAAVTVAGVRLPLRDESEGASVLAVQILLDRNRFSVGALDGRWGKNTEKAVYWFQHVHGLPTTGTVDRATLDALARSGGAGGARGGAGPGEAAVGSASGALVRRHRLGSEDVSGPFADIPRDVYEQAKLDCLCYESLSEKLAEVFHTTPAVLGLLNPGVNLDGLAAGAELAVPAVATSEPVDSAAVARIVISDGGHYVHALDAAGRLLYHFPSTLGSEYSPSPAGSYRITNVAHDPSWHYQPALLEGKPDNEPDAVLPPGPNSAVGVVWMALSEPHFGIHGTNAPETIGYVTSSGCVRLTNWDARFLAQRTRPGTPVVFRDS